MKQLLISLASFFYLSNCIGQFKIEELFITDSSQIKTPKDFIAKKNFYEDEKYKVRATCKGEFGGSIWFKNKKTGIEYACSATCPLIVNKIRGKYYVTTSLLHMGGFSEIIEIDNPELMEIFRLPKPDSLRGPNAKLYPDDYESKSRKGVKRLLDTMGIKTFTSFVSQGNLYHLIYKYLTDKLYIASIKNKEFNIVDTIPSFNLSMFKTSIITADKHQIVFFADKCVEGYFEIFEDKIIVVRYDRFLKRENCH